MTTRETITAEAKQRQMCEKMKDVPCPCGTPVPSLMMPGSSACNICFQNFCSVACWRKYGYVQHAHGRKINPKYVVS